MMKKILFIISMLTVEFAICQSKSSNDSIINGKIEIVTSDILFSDSVWKIYKQGGFGLKSNSSVRYLPYTIVKKIYFNKNKNK